MKTNKKWEIWTFISMTILIVYLIFMIYPLSTLLRNSMILKEGGVGFANFQSFFAKSYNLQTIYHSFAVSFCATIITLIEDSTGFYHPMRYVCPLYRRLFLDSFDGKKRFGYSAF